MRNRKIDPNRYYQVYVIDTDGSCRAQYDKVYRKTPQTAANYAAKRAVWRTTSKAKTLPCKVYCFPSNRYLGLYHGKTGIK